MPQPHSLIGSLYMYMEVTRGLTIIILLFSRIFFFGNCFQNYQIDAIFS